MCRNIKTLHNFEPTATDEEIRAVRAPVRPQGERHARNVRRQPRPSSSAPSTRSHHVTFHLLDDLVTSAPSRDREVEAAKARARAEKRFGAAVSA